MPPSPRRLALAVLAALCLLAAPATAGTERERDTPVGGARLGRPGTVATGGRGIPAFPAGISASAFVVADLGTGEVLAARNAHGRYLPASTLKTLTAVALIPELDPRTIHVAKFDDVNIEGSKVGLVSGERYAVGTLLEAMLIVSGNDAAHSLASAAGGMQRTTALLNATAARLQAYDTHAVNTSGLDAPGQLTSAYDLALITREGMRMRDYAKYVGTLRSRMNAPGGSSFETYNHNKMLTRYQGTTGGKTGYTIAARHCFVVTAKRGNRHLVVTLLKAEQRYDDATRLLDWGFAAAGRAPAVGHLVEPLAPAPASRVAVEQADRSRRGDTVPQAPETAAAAPPRVSDRGLPVPVLAAGAAGGLGVVGLGVRRRVRRRRYYGTSSISLRLPVR